MVLRLALIIGVMSEVSQNDYVPHTGGIFFSLFTFLTLKDCRAFLKP